MQKRKRIVFYIFIILFSFSLTRYVTCFYKVTSSSMQNTMKQGDRFLASRFLYSYHDWGPVEFQLKQPNRGDVICFYSPTRSDELFVKRVIALPGDHVQLVPNQGIFVNSEKLVEPYVTEVWEDTINDLAWKDFIVPEHSFFVLGDNRNNSYDSRYWWQEMDSSVDEDELFYSCFVPKRNVISKYMFKMPF